MVHGTKAQCRRTASGELTRVAWHYLSGQLKSGAWRTSAMTPSRCPNCLIGCRERLFFTNKAYDSDKIIQVAQAQRIPVTQFRGLDGRV